ncbi:hypothetical protein H5410_056798, partial [Solanum commersonii]
MAPKSKNVASGSGTKRGRKGEAAESSSRATNNLPPQKFGERALMHYGKDWYVCQQESKYLGDEYVDEGRLQQEFPNIHAQINALGLPYVFMNQGECNLSLVHEFYVNWNTRRVEINKGFIQDSWVRFSMEALNEFLGTPNCDTIDFLAMIERPPYRDIRHTLCGVNSIVRPVLSVIDRQAHDDSWMGRMSGMAELQLRIGGRPVTEDKMETLEERYPLMDSAMYMCQIGLAFQEAIDNDDATANEEDGSEEDKSDDIGPGDDDTDAGDGDGANVGAEPQHHMAQTRHDAPGGVLLGLHWGTLAARRAKLP